MTEEYELGYQEGYEKGYTDAMKSLSTKEGWRQVYRMELKQSGYTEKEIKAIVG